VLCDTGSVYRVLGLRGARVERRTPAHAGEILLAEFLEPLTVPQLALAEHIGLRVQRVNETVRGKRGIGAETAWLLSQALGTTPEFWLNLQGAHDLAANRPTRRIARF
jgi:addiction module HigA family antidote